MVGAVSGLVGSFAVMKRLALASDPISHIALPGLGVAFLFSFNPIIGAAAALLIGAILIWGLERRMGATTESVIGVVFSLALAVGTLITPSEDIINALFGSYGQISLNEFLLGALVSLGIFVFLLSKRRQMMLAILSPELASTAGVNADRYNLYFLLAMVLTIVLGLKYLGALLMGSLIIIPAVVSRNITRSFSSMILAGIIMSVLSVIAGILIAQSRGFAIGPTIISVAGFLFVVSLLFSSKRK